MTVIVTTAFVGMAQPAAPAALRIQPGRARIEDGYRHRPIGSLQALALAVGAALMITGLMWVAL